MMVPEQAPDGPPSLSRRFSSTTGVLAEEQTVPLTIPSET